jgi:hypothetical protein
MCGRDGPKLKDGKEAYGRGRVMDGEGGRCEMKSGGIKDSLF